MYDLPRMIRRVALVLTGAATVATLATVTTSAEACGTPAGVELAMVKPIAGLPPAGDERHVDLAICLDTSGSMKGLIESAKQKLWAIVNDLALAEPTPKLRVALLTFGNDGHDPANGWVRVDTPFTDDLDLVSQKLFALQTNGGTELVGRVLTRAGTLDWTPSDSALLLAVVAGNESADQDRETPYAQACKALITKGVMVNSIYCGPAGDAIAPGWRQVALLADGQFASIDQNQGTIVLETPFDVELATLSTKLNETYIAYGARGEWGQQAQIMQDQNAASLNSAAAAARCSTKGSSFYSNGQWDLVDACKGVSFDLATVKEEDLPEDMRAMTPEERTEHVAAMTAKRAEIQEEVKVVSRKRQTFIDEEMKRQAIDDSKSFDRVIRTAVRAQAVAKGFTFSDDTPVPVAASSSPAP